MTDKNDSRRKLLKSIAAGSGAVVAGKSLPESWSKPVIDSIVLPAHAATTDDTGSGGPSVTTTTTPTTTAAPCIVEGTYCFAYMAPNERTIFTSIVVSSGGSIQITRTNNNTPPRIWEGSGSTNGDPDGHFEITVTRTTGATNQYVYEGDIVCNSDSISGVWRSLNDDQASGNYSATQGQCAASDIRLKTNIEQLSVSRGGFSLYKFQYLADEHKNTYVGVMAQDVVAQHPMAIVTNEDGYYMVRYDLLGLRMVTLEEWENEGPKSVELIH